MEGTAGIWKLRCCGTLGMITVDPIKHLMITLVKAHHTIIYNIMQ